MGRTTCTLLAVCLALAAGLSSCLRPWDLPTIAKDATRHTPYDIDDWGYLSATSNPSDADVFVDGYLVGSAPTGPVKVRPGRHKVEMIRKGFHPWTREITICVDQAIRMPARLIPVEEPGATDAPPPDADAPPPDADAPDASSATHQ